MTRVGALSQVSRGRLADDLWRLASVPSPTGRERDAALRYAEMLRAAGAEVEVDETLPDSPSVIGRLRGSRPGATLQLAGHLDHIDVPHPQPERTVTTISARGAADMKNGLVAALEIVRILAGSGRDFPGSILVTAYGLHEAPVGGSQGLTGLIRRGVKGDAAVVLEGPPDRAVVCGKGQSIWNLHLRRVGETCHENTRPRHADELLRVALDLGQELGRESARLRAAPHGYPLLGPESVFVGQLHYGDFYNRSPSTATLQGTWRWHPDTTFDAAQAALHAVVNRVSLPSEVTVREEWIFVGESFSVDPGEAIVRALQEASLDLTGRPLELAGHSSVLDTSRLVPLGHVPTVPIDCHGETGHADREVVRLELLEAGCRLALATALCYLDTKGR